MTSCYAAMPFFQSMYALMDRDGREHLLTPGPPQRCGASSPLSSVPSLPALTYGGTGVY